MNKLTEVSVKNGYEATYNHYRKLVYPLFLILLVLLITSSVQAKYSGVGNGEPNNPYQISTAADLNDIGNHIEDFNKCFLMTNDINLAEYTGTQFNIIGIYFENPFTGVFDGNGLTISNFTYTSNGVDCIGLFGYVDYYNAIIQDLTLIDINVNAGYGDSVGALVGRFDYGTIRRCSVQDGSVSGGDMVGGLVGSEWGGTITNCFATVTVEGNDISSGGLVGFNVVGTISSCYATGMVVGNHFTGGLVGHFGIGIMGSSYIISDCYATGNVEGDENVGGLVGSSYGAISNCYATGSIDGNHNISGLVGYFRSNDIENCYAIGAVDGNDCTGGLVGYLDYDGTIEHSYAAGNVTGDNPNTGGLVGYRHAGNYTQSFWDSDINPDVNGIGNENDPNVIGKSTAEMQMESTFTSANWDFVAIWNIGENQTYPYLRIYPAGDLNHDGVVNLPDFAIFADHWLAGVE